MSKTPFQGGTNFEIFSASGKNPEANCKMVGKPPKQFNEICKSNVYNLLEPGTKFSWPKDNKIGLTQQFLVFQIFVPQGVHFSIHIDVTDIKNNKKRLQFSTAQKQISETPLHAIVPLVGLRRDTWINAVFDIQSFMTSIFKQPQQTVDSIDLFAQFMIRKIFTLKNCPPVSGDEPGPSGDFPPGVSIVEAIPKDQQFVSSFKNFATQVFWFEKTQSLMIRDNQMSGAAQGSLAASIALGASYANDLHGTVGSTV
ncbi:MAG: hypothetical protein EZS28_000702 [Streblomastix strix]|uniref:CFA20 domain-containing protein n=1 Tax=Streblomastix strix TaxID=222440 RepID=A0A5J4X9G2_9EUKA|nr:MAG: hypothetical protein EZS28_000702 [Streblomastix strix]